MSNLSMSLPPTLTDAWRLALGKNPKASHFPKARKLGPNTWLQASTIGATIVYHETPIITLYPNSFTLTNGGYFTPTTKTRLNIFLAHYGYQIAQVKGAWFYFSLHTKSVLVPFKNGDTKQMIADRFEVENTYAELKDHY